MNARIGKWLAVSALLLSLLPAWAGAAEFRRMVIFGDSLSDPGNAWFLTGTVSVPPYVAFLDPLLFSTAPYAKGGHHYSNGSTWVEQLAGLLKMPASAGAAFQGGSTRHANYAVGGSTAWDSDETLIPQQTLAAQFDAFLADMGGVPPTDALYVIAFGGNDVRDALARNDPSLLQQSIGNIALRIGTLYAFGAREFLVTSSPDLGLTPALQRLELQIPGAASGATLLSLGFNAGLDATLSGLEAALPGAVIHRLDFFSVLHNLQAQADAIGLTNVTDPCVAPEAAPFTCQDPNHYLFWDGLHPTERVHGMVAAQAAALFAP